MKKEQMNRPLQGTTWQTALSKDFLRAMVKKDQIRATPRLLLCGFSNRVGTDQLPHSLMIFINDLWNAHKPINLKLWQNVLPNNTEIAWLVASFLPWCWRKVEALFVLWIEINWVGACLWKCQRRDLIRP